MVLRTPRRRISPQTKLKYRAIKNFFSRAIGNQSRTEIKTSKPSTSNETLSTESNCEEDKFEGASTPSLSRCVEEFETKKEYDKRTEDQDTILADKVQYVNSTQSITPNTRVLYKKPKIEYERLDGNTNEFNPNHHHKFQFDTDNVLEHGKVGRPSFTQPQVNDSKNSYPKSFTHQRRIDECSMYSENSYSPNIPKYLRKQKNWEFVHKEMLHNFQTRASARKYRKHPKHLENYDLKPPKQRRTKDNKLSVNNDFINEIIRRQYKPLELFGIKDSEISQFSAPVCRDQEHCLSENTQNDPYAYEHKRRPKYPRHKNVSDMRSLCDTHLYSTVKNVSSKRREQNTDVYNDSMYYDTVPVKEKQSPKTRRKYAEDALMYYDKYIEVPPSPRTLRPRLNLDAHYNDYENFVEPKHSNDRSPNKLKRRQVYRDMLESKHCTDVPITKSNFKTVRQSCDTNTDDYVQSTCEKNIPASSSTEPSKCNNLAEENKTGVALNEIKNLLENFLEEIKKESVVFETKSNFAQPNISEQKRDCSNFFSKYTNNSNVAYNNMNNIPQSTMSPSQFIPPFVNPCVYPVMPVCHVGYMPNSCVLPSSSTCQACANAAKETTSLGQFPKAENQNVNCDTNETEVLIKEIYKFVAQKSFRDREDENLQTNKPTPKLYTTRSVGSCNKVTKQNAKIGTHPLKCYSKSCEAIVSHIATNVVTTETSNYSESTKTSQYATPTTDSYNSGTVSEKNKNIRHSRFKNVLQSFGYLKKNKKKDVIEELSESNSTTEVTDPPMKRAPYKQNIATYSMHGQEYFQRPPYPTLHCSHQKKPHDQGYIGRHSLSPGYASPPRGDGRYAPPYHHYMERPYGHVPPDPYHPATLPYSTSHDPYYHQIPPPLCLKEIEVRSSATQSERKLGFFRRFAGKSPAKKNPDANQGRLRTYSTQTPGTNKLEPTKKGLSFWQSWQEKALADRMDAEKFQKKTQRELADRDFRIKNTMVNKLFYKRNPFSPNNLIIRTLLGKDESSYGNRPKINTKVSMFV